MMRFESKEGVNLVLGKDLHFSLSLLLEQEEQNIGFGLLVLHHRRCPINDDDDNDDADCPWIETRVDLEGFLGIISNREGGR